MALQAKKKKKKATRGKPSPLCISHLFICSTHTFAKTASLHATRMDIRLFSFHSIKLPCSPSVQRAASNCTLICHQQEPPGSSMRSEVNWLVWAVPRAWCLNFPNDLDEIIQFPGLCRVLKSPAITATAKYSRYFMKYIILFIDLFRAVLDLHFWVGFSVVWGLWFSLQWLLLLCSTGPKAQGLQLENVGSVVEAPRL